MKEKIFESLSALNHLGYVELLGNDIKFNEIKISKKLYQIGTIVLHEFIYNTFAKEEILVESLAMRSICITPEEFRKFTRTRDLENLDENIKDEYMERYALIGLFYNIDEPEYKDGFYYFTPNHSRRVNVLKEITKITKSEKILNKKIRILN